MQYLVFRLYAPLASWGEPAVGETRPSATHPGRSAILGLLAAALGIRRDQHEALARLSDSLRVAVRQLSPGTLIRDYHTAQVPGHDPKARRRTRRDETQGPKHRLHTILSSREYRCDGYWRIAVSTTPDGAWDLAELAEALRRPHFALYLGRKSCPPSAPLAPQVIEAEGIREALTRPLQPITEPAETATRHLGIGLETAFAWEGDAGDLDAQETRYPYDQPLHRGRWQFTSRAEHWHQRREEP